MTTHSATSNHDRFVWVGLLLCFVPAPRRLTPRYWWGYSQAWALGCTPKLNAGEQNTLAVFSEPSPSAPTDPRQWTLSLTCPLHSCGKQEAFSHREPDLLGEDLDPLSTSSQWLGQAHLLSSLWINSVNWPESSDTSTKLFHFCLTNQANLSSKGPGFQASRLLLEFSHIPSSCSNHNELKESLQSSNTFESMFLIGWRAES